MTNTHEKEQIKKLLMICGLTLEAIKNLSIKFEELPVSIHASTREATEMGVAERISEEEK